MKPINTGGHAAYQARLISLLKQYYPDAFTRFGPSLWNTIGKFFSADLTKIDVLMYDCYSVLGPRPRLPSDMMRSFLLSLIMKKTSFTSWSDVYCIIKIPKVADKNGESCISILEKIA